VNAADTPSTEPGQGGDAPCGAERCGLPLQSALAAAVDMARRAPRVWAWWPPDGGPPRVSGRPPPDGRATDTAALLMALVHRADGLPGHPLRTAPLRHALRPDGSLPSTVLLHVVAPMLAPH
jgi:hypothetical protein